MKTTIQLVLLAVLALLAEPLHADSKATGTVASDVLKMMAKVPAKAQPSVLGRYDTLPDAKDIAGAIAATGADTQAAADAVVFAAYESSNQTKDPTTGDCLGGDKDPVTGEFQSWGPFQLSARATTKANACDPYHAAAIWMVLYEEAQRVCAASPPEDRLAWVAAGSCTNRGGLAVSRHRTKIAAHIAEGMLP